MARLPSEILAHIVSYLAAEGNTHDSDDSTDNSDCLALAPYAAVSRGWQQRIEAVTFAHIILTPARLASPLAAQALTPDRVRFVRSIRLHVLLPPYDEQARARREDDADRAANDGVFIDVVRRLLALLADDDVDHCPKIRLSLTASCVSDTEDIDARRSQWSRYGMDVDIFEARYESSYLDLRLAAEAEALPQLHCINHFHVSPTQSYGRLYALAGRHFAPQAVCLMASRMLGLERVYWSLSDNEKRDIALRKRLRADFAHALQTLPSSLRRFDLDYSRAIPLDHSFQTPSILDYDDDNDKLSLALYKLSQRLASFTLIADIGPEAIWPVEHTQDDESLWPRMQDYFIIPGAIAPSGRWLYLLSDSNDLDDDGRDTLSDDVDPLAAPGDETQRYLRDDPDPDVVRALLLATAQAVRRMPALRYLSLALRGVDRGLLEVEYSAEAGKAELTVYSLPLLQLDEDVVRLWSEAAEEYAGAGSGLAVLVREP